MKIISLIFYLLIAQFIAIGQVNLVSNPSVEGYDGSSTCQTVQHNGYQFQSVKADMAKITGWSTVDYYRGICKNRLPTPDRLCNGGHTGDGYLQMSIGADGRWELMCSELTSSTIPGHRYYFEYFIRTAPGTGHSSSHSQVGVYLSQNKAKQSASCILNGRYQTYVNGMQLFVPSNFTISEDWQIVSGVFTSIGNYSWLNVGAFDDNALLLHYDDFMLVDLGPMEEECPAIKYLQNQSFYSTNLLKANHTLLAGYNVGAPFPASNGNVVIKDYSYTVFKAGHQISIEPGFTTELNANFLAYIAPCSSNPCDAQNLPDKQLISVEQPAK